MSNPRRRDSCLSTPQFLCCFHRKNWWLSLLWEAFAAASGDDWNF